MKTYQIKYRVLDPSTLAVTDINDALIYASSLTEALRKMGGKDGYGNPIDIYSAKEC